LWRATDLPLSLPIFEGVVMIRYFLAATVVLALGACVRGEDLPAAQPKAPAAPELKTPKQQISYALGLDIGKDFARAGIEVEPAILARGIADVLLKRDPLLTPEQLQAAMQALNEQMQAARAKQEEAMKSVGEANKKAGEAFLAANAKKQGITTTASGLQYEVLKSGKGPSPKATDKVVAHYHGTLLDGKVFDSSVERKEPLEIPVNGVIEGWVEALQMMKVGDKWRLFIPSDLAYGPQGSPPVIGPNSALIFEVELLEIK
jgi:FKBP-type peptidyl-prolyl cis-trans isomerase FklB